MKKLFQICLIAILVFVLFQAVAGGATLASGQPDLAASQNSSVTNVSVEDSYASSCMIKVKGVVCVRPLVGWNS